MVCRSIAWCCQSRAPPLVSPELSEKRDPPGRVRASKRRDHNRRSAMLHLQQRGPRKRPFGELLLAEVLQRLKCEARDAHRPHQTLQRLAHPSRRWLVPPRGMKGKMKKTQGGLERDVLWGFFGALKVFFKSWTLFAFAKCC